MNSGYSYIQVVTTMDDLDTLKKLSNLLLEEKLAACVQISELEESIYIWEGKIERAKEYICVIKTRKDLYKKIEEVIKKNHPYSVPEIVAIPVIDGNKDYFNWIDEVTLKE